MPIVAAIGGVFVLAVVVKLGTSTGADAALLFRLIALPVFAGVIVLALWLYHKRKSAEHIVARYHLKGDALKWRRVSFVGRKEVRICPDCGTPTPDYKAQELHCEHHQEVWALADRVQELERLIAEARGGQAVEPVKEPPWTAVVEDATAPPTVTEHEPVTEIEQEDPRLERFREMQKIMERING